MDNIGENRIKNEIAIMNSLIKEYKRIDQKKYHSALRKCDKERFSVGGKTNMFGVYSFDIFVEMFDSNFDKGTLLCERPENVDFRYSYENSKVSIIEEYIDDIVHKISFVKYYDYEINVIGHLADYKNQQLVLNSITICKYNRNKRLRESNNCLINSNEISIITSRVYVYNDNITNIEENQYFAINNKTISSKYSKSDNSTLGYFREFELNK